MPGSLVVGTDSHSCTYGAFGAFATGIGSTDMASVFATGKLWFMVPETLQLMIEGRLPEKVTSKDVVLKIIGDIGADGANYLACEFRGSTAARMGISERMTMSNMAIEMGAKAGIFPSDETTVKYLSERVKDKAAIVKGMVQGDEDAQVSKRQWNVDDLEPQIAMPHNVDNVLPISEVPETRIDQVFLGSCTNGRFEDLHARQPDDEGRAGGQRREHDRRPGQQGGVYEMPECRFGGEVHAGGSDGGVGLLRALHGRQLRPARTGREMPFHIQPQLRRPAGQSPGVRLSGLAGYRWRQRHNRVHHRPQRRLG